MGELAPGSLSLAFCLLAVMAVGAEPVAGVNAGWQELALLNAQPARAAFESVAPADPAAREARLGIALALLQSRSRSPGTLADARERLESLQREAPDDESGIAATYYLARLAQVHDYAPDRAAAVAGYRALLARHPGHFYAQLAAPKLAVLLLYDETSPEEWSRRVAELEALIPQLPAPAAARDVRLTLGVALIRLHHDHARAYPLITACLADGSVTRMTHLGWLLVQAAESAHQLGKTQEERAWYGRFLAEFPHDAKADEVRRRLAEDLASTP